MQNCDNSISKKNNCENVEECFESLNKTDSSFLSELTNQFVSEASNIPKRMYCPFCLFDFGFDFLLKSHIHELHALEIKNFSQTKLDAFIFDPCLFCHAKFYVRGILPKHIIRKHQESILAIISNVNVNQYICCKFCNYEASMKQSKLLFIHVENKHINEFVKMLSTYNLNVNGVTHNENKINYALNEKIQKLNIHDECEPVEKLKPILKHGSLYNEYEFTKDSEQTTWIPKTRRKLRFDLPDLSISSNSSDKENVSLKIYKGIFGLKTNKTKGKPKLLPVNKIKPEPERNVLQDITISTLKNFFPLDDDAGNAEEMLFKCGICLSSFNNNSLLVNHVKRSHGKINFHARYRCGMCKAKFYRNSYLIRHSRVHIKPKCLSTYEYQSM
ncbi:hypothetical protein PGB90_006876 [Kerria lacca]